MEKRILIVEVNWLGDVLFSTPLVRAMREKFKNAYIACLAHPRTKEILEGNPRINEIIIYDEETCHKSLLGKLCLILLLRKKRFDGQVISFYIINYSIIRYVVEFFRGDHEASVYFIKNVSPYLSISYPQLFSILGFIAGIILFFVLKKKQKA